MRCDTCTGDMAPGETLISWDETDDGVVIQMKFTHRGVCDDGRLYSSAGAAYGHDWDPEHEHSGVGRKIFRIESQKARLFTLLREQAVARTAAANA